MNKQIVTLATMTALAGGVGVVSQQQTAMAASDAESSPTSVANATSQTTKTVAAAQKNLNKTQADQLNAKQQATEAVRQQSSAASQLSVATSAASTANVAQSSAQTQQSAATATAISAAQNQVNQENEQVNTAKAAVSTAQNAVDNSQTTVSAASAAASSAANTVINNQSAVSAAQAKVDQDQAALSAASSANNVSNDGAIATAQKAVDAAQADFDATHAKFEPLWEKSQLAQGGITLPAGFYQDMQTAYDLYPVYDEDGNFNQANYDKANEFMQADFDAIKIIDYQSDAADYTRTISNTAGLTFAQAKEIDEFAASIINDLREQVGQKPVKISDGSIKLLMQLSQQEVDQGMSVEQVKASGGVDNVVDNAVDNLDLSALGIPAGTNLDQVYFVYYNATDDYPAGWGYPDWLMFHLKQMIYEDISSAVPDFIMAGKFNDFLTDKGDVDQYLSCGYDAFGDLHFYLTSADDPEGAWDAIPANASFLNNAEVVAPYIHKTALTAAEKVEFDSLAHEYYDKLETLDEAQETLANLQAASSTNDVVSKAQTITIDAATLEATLKQDQAALATAQAALADSQVTAQTATKSLAAAREALTAAEAKLTTAKQNLTTAEAAQKVAKQRLAALESADINLAKAEQTVKTTQAALITAQAEYNRAVTMVQSTSVKLQIAQLAVINAQKQLQVVKSQTTSGFDDNLVYHYNRTTNKNEDQTASSVTASRTKSVSSADNHRVKPIAAQAALSMINTSTAKENRQAHLPQTGDINSGYLATLGAFLLGLLGLAKFGRKRRI
ncbi:hypothetical protein C6Y10_09985 [Lactiplantibacillus pentosus]|uniref:LPXTG cell wall anchor domain-containing protein n=1 Tax=Lactiplantibacillus pentosus TaxID=1589 RepID=UPI000D018F0D|nr:LPXTG cell wall anchor domain-containing protein [Lactiplantibacillus pentosus]PRO83152.1 hypothetical protein C6Y10_09985 [Lactiplantibacillus pentosus]